MEGLAAVQARIATIEGHIASMLPRLAASPGLMAAGSFGTALAAALGTATNATPAPRLAPGEYGRLEPPPDLIAYANGRIPVDALEIIGAGNHRLWAPAARAFRQLAAAADADGVRIGITDSYRDFQSQVRVAERKGLYEAGGLAARPGSSTHGWGLAIDLDLDDRAQVWMRENAWRYGFVEDVVREPWHWTYRPGQLRDS